MGVTRRGFLQRAGLALATWGVSELGLWNACQRYQAVLAAPTARKLALLVGINQYPHHPGLEGCVTDVELQRELLIHRFGLRSQDVYTLTDQQATRDGIETAFVELLIGQARPGDVVVFHFSGFGRSLAAAASPDRWQPTLVPADEPMSQGATPLVHDLTEDTLWLLLRSLKTDKVTTILDTSHFYPGTPLQGNLRVRALPNPARAQVLPSELEFQEQLLHRLNLDRENLAAQRRGGQLPGVVLSAGPVATENHWHQLRAGLFTQALTQALWQATPATSVRVCLSQVSAQIERLVNQQPRLAGQKGQEPSLTPYFLASPEGGADGTILAVEADGKTLQLWLGGLFPSLLEQYGIHSLLTVEPLSSPGAVSNPQSLPLTLQITAREGLKARATVYCARGAGAGDCNLPPLHPGQRVQEALRVLPRNIGLTVALDGSLERIERVDAISALSSIPHISSAIAGEQPADYLFSKLPGQEIAKLASLPTASPPMLANSPAPASRNEPNSGQSNYGLFSPGRDRDMVTSSSTGEGAEAVKGAVRRLAPKLQTLLANKLLTLTINDRSSRLGIQASLELAEPQERPLLQLETGRGTNPPPRQLNPLGLTGDLLQLPVGSRIRYRVVNRSPNPIYLLLLSLDSASNLMALYAPELPPLKQAGVPSIPQVSPAQSIETTSLSPGETWVIPTTGGNAWSIQGPSGLTETYLIASRAPLGQTLVALAAGLRPDNSVINGFPIPNPLEVAQAVLQDLHQAHQAVYPEESPDIYALDVQTWATLRFVYHVV